MKLRTINTILYCRKWPEVLDFYKTKLSLEISAEFDWFVEFKLNETARLSVADAGRATVESSAGKGITISMEVDDINGAWIYLKNAGLHPTGIKDHAWGAKVLYIHDPEGNRIEFWSALKTDC